MINLNKRLSGLLQQYKAQLDAGYISKDFFAEMVKFVIQIQHEEEEKHGKS